MRYLQETFTDEDVANSATFTLYDGSSDRSTYLEGAIKVDVDATLRITRGELSKNVALPAPGDSFKFELLTGYAKLELVATGGNVNIEWAQTYLRNEGHA